MSTVFSGKTEKDFFEKHIGIYEIFEYNNSTLTDRMEYGGGLMNEEFGNDIVTLTDDEGNELVLEHLDTVEYNGMTYLAFIPEEMSVEDSYELIIMKVEQENGEEMLVTLDDEDELAEMFQIFSERLEDTFEEEESEEEGEEEPAEEEEGY